MYANQQKNILFDSLTRCWLIYNEDTFTDSALEKKIMYKRIDTKVQLHTHTQKERKKNIVDLVLRDDDFFIFK